MDRMRQEGGEVREGGGCAGWKWKAFPTFPQTVIMGWKPLFLEEESKWCILCSAEH